MKLEVHPKEETQAQTRGWIQAAAWIAALLSILAAGFVAWQVQPLRNSAEAVVVAPPPATLPVDDEADVSLPAFHVDAQIKAVSRETDPFTIIPDRPRQEVVQYKVDFGDSVFGIAKAYNVTPETVLWANYDVLNDNPDFLTPGMELNIPPINGVYYQWEEGDSLESIASRFEADLNAIFAWPGNNLDLIDPVIDPGTFVMIPDGHREFRQWLIPTIPRGAAGVSPSVYGPGACEGGYTGVFGTGTFIYPTINHQLSGNDYWSGHLGIDLAAGIGDGVKATDSGVVVFSGWATGGYGYMVMIDHGNGYQSVYAHLSQTIANCGQSVSQGQVIALSGSTGNSTGSHLHFEIRYLGGFISPWFALPAP